LQVPFATSRVALRTRFGGTSFGRSNDWTPMGDRPAAAPRDLARATSPRPSQGAPRDLPRERLGCGIVRSADLMRACSLRQTGPTYGGSTTANDELGAPLTTAASSWRSLALPSWRRGQGFHRVNAVGYVATVALAHCTTHQVPAGNSTWGFPLRHASYARRYAARNARKRFRARCQARRVSAENVGLRPKRSLRPSGRALKGVATTASGPRTRRPLRAHSRRRVCRRPSSSFSSASR
jgi:hypothetical protein